MNLEVNLDGEGAAERTGTLWARNFRVLGDPVVIEVLQSADSNRSERRNVVRQQFEFEIMRVPFSVGHGQFVMHNAVINGPFEGATLRGKVDFRAQVHRRRRHLRGRHRHHAGDRLDPAARARS